MDIRALDLNLLVGFDAMTEHRSVTRAGEALRLSQPAMSASVARLRGAFDDPLFVKAGTEMRATPRAQELAPPSRQVIEAVKADILQTAPFDAATTRRTFSQVAPDIAEVTQLPTAQAHLAALAPLARLRILSWPRHAAADCLEAGNAEQAVGYFPDLNKTGYFQQKTFQQPGGLHRAHRPPDRRCGGGAGRLPGGVACAGAARGREHVVDQFLREHGLLRRIALEISHFTSLLPIIAGSDLIATMPQDMADFCVRHGDIRCVTAPIESPAIEVFQFWHRQLQKDPTNAWLQGCLHAWFGG